MQQLLRLVLVAALCSCNSLTGANDLSVRWDEDDDADDDDSSDPSSAAGDHPEPGAGGASSTGAVGPTGSGGGSGSVAAASSSSGPTCMYPTTGIGVLAGDVVPGNLSWQGYAENSAQIGTVGIQDYFDCDGTKGVNALLLITSAEWCGVCQQEASEMPDHAASFAAKGIKVVTLMAQDQYSQPADTAVAQKWRQAFGLDAFAVVADPQFSFATGGTIGLPLQVLVDPRTMEIVSREEGYSGSHAAVIALATANGG